MQLKETIRFALTASNGAVLSAIDEMSDAPTTFPTPNGGCHPLWVIGHLAVVEGMIPEVLFGDENPAAEWRQYFGQGTEPVGDASAYPPFAEVREKYVQLRERNLTLLESLSEEDLNKPAKAPPKGLEHEFGTYGNSFIALALHQMMHRSHVTDAKRAAGRITVAAQAA
ncbi:MAG: DinB family protein [Bryobacteraceae bacterium]